jgi:N-acetylmuramoyl-L-alanine amidase
VEYGYFIHPTEFACLQKEATQQQLVAGTIAGIETLF